MPDLKRFKNRVTLKSSEKALITRRAKALAGVDYLHPVSKKETKLLGKRKLFLDGHKGIRAIRIRGFDPATTKLRIKKGGEIDIKQASGRHWIFWSLDREQVRSGGRMKMAARAAFNKMFPIEKVSELTKAAFKEYNVQQVQLWTHAGPVGRIFDTENQFILWVNERWQAGRYVNPGDRAFERDGSDPGEWVNGIAILIENKEYTARRNELDRQQREAKKNAS